MEAAIDRILTNQTSLGTLPGVALWRHMGPKRVVLKQDREWPSREQLNDNLGTHTIILYRNKKTNIY